MKKKTKKLLLKVHEVLGLVTGLVVLLVSLTGALWVFKDEIQSFSSEYKAVVPQEKPFITATEAKNIALEVLPNR